MMLSRSSRTMLVAKRCMSSVSPRTVIAQNIVAISDIFAAKSEAEIAAAKVGKPIDIANLPPALAGYETYLAASTVAAGTASVKDLTSWHNKKGLDFILAEAGRESTWPFLVGVACSWLLLGVALPAALPKEGKKDSKYIQRRDGLHVYKKGGAHDGHHDAHAGHH